MAKIICLIILTGAVILNNNCTAFKTQKGINPLAGDSSFSSSSMNPALTCNATTIDHTTLRRLSNSELANSLNDILEVSVNTTRDLPADYVSTDGFTNNGDFTKITDQYFIQLMPAIESALASAVSANSKVYTCATAKDNACAQGLIQTFVNRAFRKKVASSEVTALVNLFTAQKNSGLSFEDALSVVYERILLSPNFLIRVVSQSGNAVDGIVGLTNYEIASRLSYFLWNSLPDTALIEAASKNEFSSEHYLRIHIDRMLKDPKAKRFADSFVGQWLAIERILSTTNVVRDGLTDQLRQDMLTESKMFVNYVLLQGKSVQDLVGGEYTFLNQRLAEHYGIPNVTGENFRLVDLKGTGRRGLLTQGAFLTVYSKVTETTPIGRGKQILNLITCNPPPPFDGGDTITELSQALDPNLTIREKMEIHRANPKCAGCHTSMDPIGLGLEGFGITGRPRTTYENGKPILTAGVLTNIPFNTPAEMLEIVNSRPEFKRCISKNMMVYAIGRAATVNDLCVTQQIGNLSVQPGKNFTDLVMSLVMSQQFRFNSVN